MITAYNSKCTLDDRILEDMIKYIPKLYKVSAICEQEKNRQRGHLGGINVEFKVLLNTEEDYENVVNRSSILIDIINKEYPQYECRLTDVSMIRRIPVSNDLVDPLKPSLESTTSKALNSLLDRIYGRRYEDPAIYIHQYDIDNGTCIYSIITSDGLCVDKL